MFKEELEDLKNRYLTRLVLHHVFSDEHTDAPINRGPDEPRQDRRVPGARWCRPRIDHAFVCGPYQMNDEAEAALLAAGVGRGAHPHRALRHRAAGRTAGGRRDPPGRSRATPRCAHGHDHPRRPAPRDRVPQGPAEHPRLRIGGRPRSAVLLHLGRVRHLPRQAASKARCAWSATSRSTRPRSPRGFVLTCQAHPLTERVVLSFDER